jgi:hypothetical protein
MSDPFAALEAEEESPAAYGPPKPPALPPEQVPVRNPNPTGYDPTKLRNPGEGFGGYLGEAFNDATRAANYGMADAVTFGNADELAGTVGNALGKGYAESRDEYRDARAAADAASPYSKDMAQASTSFGMGAASKAGLGLQMAAGAVEGLGRSDALDSQAFLNSAVGAAMPLALPAAGAAKDAVVAGARGLGNVARKAVYNPGAENMLSTGMAKTAGVAIGSKAGPIGAVLGLGTGRNPLTDAVSRKVMEGVRARVKPPTVAIPEAPPPASLSIPPLSSALDTPVAPNLSLPPKPSMPSASASIAPTSPYIARPNAPSATPTNPYNKPPAQSLDDFLGPESVAPTKVPSPWGVEPHALPNKMLPGDAIEGPNYYNFTVPQNPTSLVQPVETLNTLRPPALPNNGLRTDPFIPPAPYSGFVPSTPPPSFAPITAPTTPYTPPAPATAANRVTLRPGEAPPSFVPQPPPPAPTRQTLPFVDRLAKAAEVTDNPEVQTTLEKIASLHATDPTKAAAYHMVQVNKNPAYRETLRIVEGK